MENPVGRVTASEIWDILVECVGASESGRDEFVWHQSENYCSEYRFMGRLGFGGKFWRNRGYRHDGSWGEKWYVNQYAESAKFGDAEAIAEANNHLDALLAEYEGRS